MRVRNLDTFYWVASLGSFRAAAEKLNLTQPAVSARIQVLEEDLGATVFVRELKKANLTPVGRKLFGFAEKLMDLEQEVLTAFADIASIEQTIRLGASETIVSTWLPDFLGTLSRARDTLSFELRVDSTDNMRNALVAREIDLAFLMGPIAEVSITNSELCTYEMVFAAPPALAGLHRNWGIEDIARQVILTFATNTKPNRQIREMLAPHVAGSPRLTTSTSLGAIIRLASSGMGICAVPRAVIERELQKGDLEVLRTEVEIPGIAFTASYAAASPFRGLLAGIIEEAKGYLEPRLIENIYQNREKYSI